MVPSPEVTILLVEDDEALRRILAGHLRRHGYDVVEADSAEDAAERLASGLFPRSSSSTSTCPGDTGWDLLRGPAMQAAGRPPVVVASAVTVSPRHLARVRRRGLSAQALPARDPTADGRAPA